MKTLLLFIIILLAGSNYAQTNNTTDSLIRITIDDLFTAMRKGDSLMARNCFTREATLKTCYIDNKGKTVIHSEELGSFMKAIGTPHKEVWNEQISNVEIRSDDRLAMVWAPYEFYVDREYSHKGVNLFEMVYVEGKWLILSITDTRRK